MFVDFSKAFDSVHRGVMLKILKAYGIPLQLIQIISKLYEGTRARVISPDGETDYFNIVAGVLQGDTLAPYLFAIIVDYLMRNAIHGKEEELGFILHPRKSNRVPATVVTVLDFADDIALLCNEIHQAQELLKRVEIEAARSAYMRTPRKQKSSATININRKMSSMLSTADRSEEWTPSSILGVG